MANNKKMLDQPLFPVLHCIYVGLTHKILRNPLHFVVIMGKNTKKLKGYADLCKPSLGDLVKLEMKHLNKSVVMNIV